MILKYLILDGHALKEGREFVLVSREEWNARPPKLVEPMPNPVPYVIIHHSYIPAACNTTTQCIQAMQSMQIFHQVSSQFRNAIKLKTKSF